MDKSAIRNFAIEARKILMKSAITEAGFYGITKDGCKSPIQKGQDFEVYETLAGTENRIFGSDIKRRTNLVRAIEEQGFEQVIEETAYTWFNRIIAIRFMEVNDYLPTRVRVLSSETGSNTPDIVTQSLDVDLNMTPEELEKVQLAKDNNKYDEAFRLLFIKQSNELNNILPGLFEKTNDYMELLLKLSYTGDGVVRMLVDTVPEDSFNVETEGQVEIIGWMYQYYNTELKDDTFAKLKKKIKISKDRIPAATQLFTPDWIVRYMVENSLGRVWIEHLKAVSGATFDEKEKANEYGWKYYLPEINQNEDTRSQLKIIIENSVLLKPQDIKCIDPCMGSGHVLVYIFDVLMNIYVSEGFSERDAVFEILKNNIHGLDIDRRAYQLSYFALMMKARGYNRVFFRNNQAVQVEPMICAIEDSNSINEDQLEYFGIDLDKESKQEGIIQIKELLIQFKDAKEYGSILSINQYNWDLIKKIISNYKIENQISFNTIGIDKTQEKLEMMLKQAMILTQKYHAVITNPPYMGSSGMDTKLLEYTKKYYPDSKSDFFAVFIEKCNEFVKKNGYYAMITQPSFLSLASFEKMRKKLLDNNNIISLLHLGRGIFGIDFGSTSFVIRKGRIREYKASYFKLYDRTFQYIEADDIAKLFLIVKENHDFQYNFSNYDTQKGIENTELAGVEKKSKIYFSHIQSDFKKIPGLPIAYWAEEGIIDAFEQGEALGKITVSRNGMKTGDNAKFLRLWWEVSFDKVCNDANNIEEAIASKKKWFPYNKGGETRKWYGNDEYIVNWENEGFEIFKCAKQDGRNVQDYPDHMKFTPSGTWSLVSSGRPTFRYKENNLSDIGGMSFYLGNDRTEYYLGFCNTPLASAILQMLAPTINYQAGDIGRLPIIWNSEMSEMIKQTVKENITIAKDEWNSYETSYNFRICPFLQGTNIEVAIENKIAEEKERFLKLYDNECLLNKTFLKIYGINENEYEVKKEEITFRISTPLQAVKQIISYAVGCMFGRYSLDNEGVLLTDKNISSDLYSSFIPDKDNIIPITDESYFNDDIVELFANWIEIVYGKENTDINLKYIARILSEKTNGNAKDIIRKYFLEDFFNDHCDQYSITGSGKRPIYWMFDSGKQNGFKCLIYIHRYVPDLVGLIRSDYLNKTQNAIEKALENAEYIIATSESAVDKARSTKLRDKYLKQINEIKSYYQALSHVALQRIDLNLDDGIKENYAKFQGVEVSNEGTKKQTIDLLAKI